MTGKILVGGSAADPPHLGHVAFLSSLLEYQDFDHLIWIPSGYRFDKKVTALAHHRAMMTALTVESLSINHSRLFVDFSELDDVASPTIIHIERLSDLYPNADVVWVTGVDSVVPLDDGRCEIEEFWHRGEELMKEYPFIILPRPGYPDPRDLDLPPHFEVKDIEQMDISSSEIRNLIVSGEPFDHLVVPSVAEYIMEEKLYLNKEIEVQHATTY